MKQVLAMLLWSAAGLAGAATLEHNPVSLPVNSGIALQAAVSDPKTEDLIDKVNEYAFAQLLIDSGEAARNHFNDRIHWEFHLGAGEAIYPGNVGTLPDYQDGATGSYSFFTAGIKYNLTNPKMVKPYDVLAELRRLDNLLQVRSFKFSDELDGDCKRMIADNQAYLDNFWFKRWSLGVDFAYITRGYGYSQSSNYNAFPYSSSSSSSYGNFSFPGFDFSNPFFYVGTDLGDYLTIKAGYSARNQLMVGVSTDISTVMFVLGTDFFNYIKSFSGAPSAAGYSNGGH